MASEVLRVCEAQGNALARTALPLPCSERIDVSADAKTGAVNLEGSVPNMQQRKMAEDVARNTDGVHSVNNQLAVPPTAAAQRSRQSISSRATPDPRNAGRTYRRFISQTCGPSPCFPAISPSRR